MHVHSKLCNINLLNDIPSLLFRNLRGQVFSDFIALLVVMLPSHMSQVFVMKLNHQKIQTTRLHTSRWRQVACWLIDLQARISTPCMYTLHSVISTSLMSLLFFYLETLGNRCSQFISHSLLSCFLPIYHGCRHSNQPPKDLKHTSRWHRVACCLIDLEAWISTPCTYTSNFVVSTSLISCIHSLVSRNLRDRMFSVYFLLHVVMCPLPYIRGFVIKLNH